MTPNRIQEIFATRGYEAARATAVACADTKLQALVERLKRERRNAPQRPGKTARDRASGAAARRAENKARRDEENRARAMSAGGG